MTAGQQIAVLTTDLKIACRTQHATLAAVGQTSTQMALTRRDAAGPWCFYTSLVSPLRPLLRQRGRGGTGWRALTRMITALGGSQQLDTGRLDSRGGRTAAKSPVNGLRATQHQAGFTKGERADGE